MKILNKLRVALLVIATAFAVPIASAEDFVIDHYQVDIDVLENNVYNISEVIDVNFSSQRHGIYREIPLKFDDMTVVVSNISVPGHAVSVSKDRRTATIRIGSADSYVFGKQRYSINYTYDVGADSLSDMDEFNHNLIGNQWGTSIAAVDFTIQMPKAFNADDVNVTSGVFGSTDNTKATWQVNGNRISGRTLEPLMSREGLTLALPLPEGYWVGAQTHGNASWFITLLGYPLYFLVILISAGIWYRKGRDNRLFPTVEFEPPEGMTPAEVGYVIDGRVDSKDVTSLIIYWAEKGYLSIEEETSGALMFKREKLILTKLKDIDPAAKGYEKDLFQTLFQFGDGTTVSTKDLVNKFYRVVSLTKSDITKSFTEDPERRIYVKGTKRFTMLTSVLAALPIITILFQGFYVLMESPWPALLFSVPFSLFLLIQSFTVGSVLTGQSGKASLVFSFIFGGFSLFFFAMMCVIEGEVSMVKYGAAVLTTIATSIFVALMSRRTPYGDRVLERTLGFKEFINSAEKDKLEALFESNPSYFYDILPYAMVLGLSDKWSAQFDGMAVSPPTWYRGSDTAAFSAGSFSNRLDGSFKSINSSMTSSPSSKGSSGSSSSGGSSGGGSGGGGGGSW
jgi:uncharacterized membrane protein YgcG